MTVESEFELRSKPVSDVSTLAKIGEGTKIWAFSKICDGVQIGDNSIVGRFVYIGPGVEIGSNCKIQNNALLYEPAILGNGVFIGPGAILTNDLNPRAVNSKLDLKTQEDWNKQGVKIEEGASIGAGAICIAPVQIGKWSLVGAGAVVTKNVSDFALVVGSPAKRVGWVGKAGFRLNYLGKNIYSCPKDGSTYIERDNLLEAIEPNSKEP